MPPIAAAAARPLLLAVSGGPDSLALLLVCAANRAPIASCGFRLAAATVDHGLRPESAREAADVARICRDLRVPHATLAWRGPKPAGNLAAAAREARYRLLADHAEALGAPAILAAHHEDDQIETHHLATLRRAGDRGLAGMRDARALAPGLTLLRPFLAVAGARLKGVVAACGLAAVDDPANRDPRFARARLRLMLESGATGEADRRAVLARIAAHAARRDAEDRALAPLVRRLAVDGRGVVGAPPEIFAASRPSSLADALLGRILRAAGGAEYPPPHRDVRRLRERVLAPAFRGATLGGAEVVRRGEAVVFRREYGRTGPPAEDVAGRGQALFDRRLRVLAPAGASFPPGARLVAFGRGNPAERTLPLLLGPAGEAVAAHPALLAKLPPALAALGVAEEVSFRLAGDLPAG